jgi:hypothetical protein
MGYLASPLARTACLAVRVACLVAGLASLETWVIKVTILVAILATRDIELTRTELRRPLQNYWYNYQGSYQLAIQ